MIFCPLIIPLLFQAQQTATPARYGFVSHEIYKFDEGIRELASGDFDGDGVVDLVLVNNARSRLEILRRLPRGAPDHVSEPDGADTGSPLSYDGRFAIRRYPVERQVLELATGDMDADGKTEIVFALDGGELVRLDELEGEPKAARSRIDELRSGCALLATADLDGDGAAECLAASLEGLHSFSRTDGFARATLLDRLESGPGQVFAIDVDGDRLRDLVYLYFEQDYPLRVRRGLGGAVSGRGSIRSCRKSAARPPRTSKATVRASCWRSSSCRAGSPSSAPPRIEPAGRCSRA
jgi:hypothetical protein